MNHTITLSALAMICGIGSFGLGTFLSYRSPEGGDGGRWLCVGGLALCAAGLLA